MAATKKLKGSVLNCSLAMLNEVTDILERYSIQYSLDGGTALGVIREGRLLPWDTDMDIAIDSSQVKALKPALWTLFFRDYRIRIRRLHTSTHPINGGAVRAIKVWRRKWLFFKGPEMLDISVRHKNAGFCYWVLGGSKKHNKTVVNSMPITFHDELKKIHFNNKNFYVAKEDDAFLTYRYGDWRTPVKQWDAFKHDGALLHTAE